MKKYKAWLTNEIEIMESETSENYPHEQMVEREMVLILIDQLDEPEKVIIPQFVAEWIAKHRDTFDLYPALKELEDKPAAWKPGKRIYEWYRMNTHQFVNAYLTGEYEVKEEQKYYVIFPSVDENGKGFNYLAKDTYHNELWIEDSRTDGLDWEERSSFTEDEIRDLDKGDILFEQFAVKVEEKIENGN